MKRLAILLFILAPFTQTAFSQQHAVKAGSSLNSEHYIKRYGRLDNVLYRIKTEKSATVAFFGGSITNMKGWRDMVCEYLQKQYPETRFNFINAGIPSLGSLPHAFRMENDVLSKGRIDLLFVESAVNDHGNGTSEKTQRRALEGITRHLFKANPYANMVLMAFVDEDKMKDYRAGKTPAEVQVHEDLARMYHLPFINLAKEITDRIDAGEFTWKDDFKNLHPSPFGQTLYFNTIRQLLNQEFSKNPPAAVHAARLPPPADPLNYAAGKYLSIEQAKNLQGFELVPSWQPADSVHTRPGFVNVPALVSEKAGSSFELPFNGRTVGIGVIAGPDAGMLRYSIDGGPEQTVDLYTQWSANLHLPWYLLLGDDLKPGKHTVKVSIAPGHNGKSKGTACRVVYFLSNN